MGKTMVRGHTLEVVSIFGKLLALIVLCVQQLRNYCTGAPLTDDVDVAVCTFEKANVLINQLLDEGRESRLIMVVVDELHLVSDTQRGFLLEVLLTKVHLSTFRINYSCDAVTI
jgi:superfamily II helicase